MKFVVTLLLLLPIWHASATEQRFSIAVQKLGEEFTVQVSLPDSYLHSERYTYPLLLVLDGSVQFKHTVSSAQFLSTYAVIPEMIVVGVSTQNRLALFTPSEPESFAGRSGRAEDYMDFLQTELLSLLREKYRIAPYSIISGHSLSGLFTSYIALTGQSEFNAAISISPSLWWDKSTVISTYVKNPKPKAKHPMRWFLSMASEPGEMSEAFNAMLVALKEHPQPQLHYTHAHFAAETHDSTPLVGTAKGLQAIFADWNAVPEVAVMPLQKLQEYYQAKAPDFGYTFPMSAHQYNVYGLKATYEEKTAWGVEILEQGTQDFPASEVLWDSLATAYKRHGALQKAMMASTRALHLALVHDSIFISEIKTQNEQLKLALDKH